MLPVDQIGLIPKRYSLMDQSSEEQESGAWKNMTRHKEQCDPLIRSATRASPLLPSHKRRCYLPSLSQNLSNYSRFISIHPSHPITLNPLESVKIYPETVPRDKRWGVRPPSRVALGGNLHFNVLSQPPSQGSATQGGGSLLAVNCARFWPHFSFN